MAHLENWSLGEHPHDNPYMPPEQRRMVLSGIVTGHHKLPDGKAITTSTVLKLDHKLYPRRAETKNTVYTLGKKDPAYAKYLREFRAQQRKLAVDKKLCP